MALETIMLVPNLILNIIMIFLGALFLMLSAKIFKLKDKSYMTPLKINAVIFVLAIIFGLIGFLGTAISIIMGILAFLVYIVLAIYLIKRFYKIDWGKAALTWLIWAIFSIIAGAIIGVILAVIFVFPVIGSLI